MNHISHILKLLNEPLGFRVSLPPGHVPSAIEVSFFTEFHRLDFSHSLASSPCVSPARVMCHVIEPTLFKSQNITDKNRLDKNIKFAFRNVPKRTENEQVRFLFCIAENRYDQI